MICIADLRTSYFTKVNPTFCKVLGYSEQELLTRPLTDFIHPDDVKRTSESIEDQLKRGELVIAFENRYICKDGSIKFLEWGASPISEKGITYSIARDVTERKRAEKELAEAKDKVVQSHRLAEIGQLASGIAHELRNPLAIINNSSYFLQMKLDNPDEKVVKHLDIMQSQIFRSSHIIEGLLDFASTGQPNITTADLYSVLEEVMSTADTPKSIKVNIDGTKDLPLLKIDREQMLRVFSNLISNAIQAMPDGGKLSVISRKDGDYVITEVIDIGIGIANENLSKIFEPMFTTKADMGGVGIGLSITKSLVEANKGTIKVKSTVSKGTTFTIKLPSVGK